MSNSGSEDEVPSGTRKRKSFGRMSDVMKKIRLFSHETGPSCECVRLKCYEKITEQQRQIIIKNFNGMETYNAQNLYLFGLMSSHRIKKRRPRNAENVAVFHENVYTYKVRVPVPNDDNLINEVPVCFKAFKSLHGITSRRVQSLQESFKKTGCAPIDGRGKYTHDHCKTDIDVIQAVKNHISSFKGRPSHYSKSKSNITYLPESLNIKKMYDMYKDLNVPPVSYEFYRKIINNNFNIKFGYPRCDTPVVSVINFSRD